MLKHNSRFQAQVSEEITLLSHASMLKRQQGRENISPRRYAQSCVMTENLRAVSLLRTVRKGLELLISRILARLPQFRRATAPGRHARTFGTKYKYPVYANGNGAGMTSNCQSMSALDTCPL